jgi:hypothetical protein
MGGLLALMLIAGCDRSQPAEPRAETKAGSSAAAAAPGAAPAQGGSGGMLNGMVGPAPKSLPEAGAEEEKKGPTRRASCQIDDEPERACDFTPVFGDGSFDIAMPDRQLRLIVSGSEAAPFELIGTRRIPIVGLLQRDPRDPACWVSDDPDAILKRVCAR